jgi:5-methyltetrahydropteroyltriglutamate--homocysteine methyltransferase
MTRILTTHIGALPGPLGFIGDGSEATETVRAAVDWVVARQREAGLDVVNEGELTKGGDWLAYLDTRFSGFEECAPPESNVSFIHRGRDRAEFAEFYKYATERETLFYLADKRMKTRRPHFVAKGPIGYAAAQALDQEIGMLRAATDDPAAAFLTATAPASVEPYRYNAYYKSEEEFVFAIAEALQVEYETIAAAGFKLQVDDAWLVALWDRIGVDMGLEAFRKRCMMRVEALNHALRNIPTEQIRYHLCWGSWHGPHVFDIPLADIVDVMLAVKARYYLIEAANPRHEHEWEIWKERRLPDGKVLVPGCVTHSTDIVEHPILVAQRLKRFADLIGAENLMAGADCGFAGRCHPQIAWAKLRALAEGADLASREL